MSIISGITFIILLKKIYILRGSDERFSKIIFKVDCIIIIIIYSNKVRKKIITLKKSYVYLKCGEIFST